MDTGNRELPIVVGIDGSSSALRAAEWATREAQRRQLGVVLLHAMTPAEPETVFGAPDVDRDYGRRVLDEAAVCIAADGSTVDVEIRLATGGPTAALIEASRSAAMVVVGCTGVGSFSRAWLGSTAMSLVESAECIAVVVRGRTVRPADSIIVGLGTTGVHAAGTDADSVLAEAFRAADAADAPLIGVLADRTIDLVDPVADPMADPVSRQVALDRVLMAGRRFPTVRADSAVIDGSPRVEMVELSERAQLMVVGHEHGRAAGPMLRALLRRGRCPVMVVPHP